MSHGEDVLTSKNGKYSKKYPELAFGENNRICPSITIKDKEGRSRVEFVSKFKD